MPERLRKANGSSWSFFDLEHSDPQRLAERLANAGLPLDWRPSLRSRPAPLSRAAADGIPVELRLGWCMEVFASHSARTAGLSAVEWEHRRSWMAFRGYHEARRSFLVAHDIDQRHEANIPEPLRGFRGPPWSIDYLAEHDAVLLADLLGAAGLPPDWRPE